MFSRTIALRAGSAASAAPCRACCNKTFGMPLRAKIAAPGGGVTTRASMSTTSPRFSAQRHTEDDPEDVIFNSHFGLRTIELNRPKKLNSLNESMVRKILPRMREWEKSDMANIIVMKGVGEKALCAGGDVAALAKNNKEDPEGWKQSSRFFNKEYALDHYIATYQKPYIAFMDGITMGGGVGLSVHAPLRIATERTVYAMPETTIGFFPDVGASFFLPKMNGAIGTYLALTSDRLKGVNVFYSGIATHYLHSTSLPQVEARLAELQFKDYDSLDHRLALINETIEEYCTGLPHDEPIQLSGELRQAIDRCFSENSIVDIIKALKAETGSTKAWADKTLDTLHKRSPTAVNVALRQMRVGKTWSIAETFRRESQIAAKFMRHPDFTEGVSALLMSKDNPRSPQWQPATLEDITNPSEVVDPFFQVGEDEPVKLVNDRDFTEYPFGQYGVPSENDVRSVVEAGSMTPKEVVRHLVAARNGRQGVEPVVSEIVSRRCQTNEDGHAEWVEA